MQGGPAEGMRVTCTIDERVTDADVAAPQAHQSARRRHPREHAQGCGQGAGQRRSRRGVGQQNRQGHRRHLGRGEVPIRRQRRTLGGRAAVTPPSAEPTCSRGRTPRHRFTSGWPAIIDTLYEGLTSSDSRAIENLRAALAARSRRTGAALSRAPPLSCGPGARAGSRRVRTRSWAWTWTPTGCSEIAALIPGAMRGITSERQLGTYADLDMARRGLTNAIAVYLEGSRSVRP